MEKIVYRISYRVGNAFQRHELVGHIFTTAVEAEEYFNNGYVDERMKRTRRHEYAIEHKRSGKRWERVHDLI